MSRPDIYGILGADFCLSSDVSSHGFLNALAILPTQVSKIMGALMPRLDYQPLFGKMSPHSIPERATGRVRFPLLV